MVMNTLKLFASEVIHSVACSNVRQVLVQVAVPKDSLLH